MIITGFQFLLCFALIKLILALPKNVRGMDFPNHRSMHSRAIPRVGGIAIVLTTVVTWLFFTHLGVLWLSLLIAIAIMGLLDDLYGLSPVVRMAIQLLVAYIFAYYSLQIYTPAALFCVVFGMAWVCNLYNFMDGANGLAGGMAVFGFSTYALVSYFTGNYEVMQLCVGLVAANLAFLCFNFNSAKIFMGDVGSLSLGFLAATIGLHGLKMDIWSWWLPIFVFSPFIADTTVTLAKRLLRREKVWLAHRNHYYQRLIQMGWDHKKLALVSYTIMALSSMSAIFAMKYGYRNQLMLVWAAFYLVAMYCVDARWTQFLQQSSKK